MYFTSSVVVIYFTCWHVTSFSCANDPIDYINNNNNNNYYYYTKINYGLDTMEDKEKRTSKKNVDGRSTSNHDNKKFRTRSMEKQRGMVSGFRKPATALKNPER